MTTDGLLFAGEERVERADLGETTVVVTTHRVLVVGGERPLRVEYRPNVTGASVETTGRTELLRPGARAAVGGAVALAAGSVIDLDVGAELTTPEGTGLGGLFGLLGRLLDLLALLDDALLLAGALGVLAGGALVGWYLLTRHRQVVLGVAGGDDLRVRAAAGGQEAARRLDAALTQD
ncbi:MAG: hypothetical protein ABEH77_09490 [Halobacteriaceae archaeon]